ncbi:DUF296 domain-containing protein [Candidatus Woesearchaeota archaeon]|nr:DUF296 domain-containing protein [Candidatus Woesearchaeota archaeon]
MKTIAIRLTPGQDLKEELGRIASVHQIRAGIVLTCVGSLTKATLRLADETIQSFDGPFEIVSVVGTLCQDGLHLHASLADSKGIVIGGHLKKGCLVHTTAEIVIAVIERVVFKRLFDNRTGFKELVSN